MNIHNLKGKHLYPFQIEKVGSDGSKEETEVEAARRQQRLTLIASARGDGGSKFGGLAQQNLTHLAPSLSPPHTVIPTTPSEQLQLKLTLSAREEIQKREIHQMRTSFISNLRSEVRTKGSFSNSFFSVLRTLLVRLFFWFCSSSF